MPLNLSRLLAGLALMIFAAAIGAHTADAQGSAPRVALVIGNGAYAEAPIEDAVEGARQVADVLRQGGFTVLYLENARRDEIQQGLAKFAQGLERGGNGIVFYSGHAVQYQGRNYLLALDTKITDADDVRREAVDVDLFLDPLIVARTPGSVIILDASRSNPWQPLLPGGHRGLAEPEPVESITFVCSAAPGRVVSSAPRAGKVFSEQLVQAMKTPDLGFDDIIGRTRAAVARINGKDQRVWQSDDAPRDLVVISASKAAAAKPADAVETGFWDSIKNSSAAADFQAYLSAYPNGQFALIARSKLAQLQPKAPERAAARDQAGRQTAAAKPEQSPGLAGNPAASSPASSSPQAPAAPIRDCPSCPELVLIPAGTMMMGSTEGFAFEAPVHEVTISKPFYMGRREVTFDEWDACLREGGCQYRPGDRGQGRGLRPASDLDWNDAKAYVAWLSRKTGKTYRLPTEAEWEYAVRAGTKTAYYWGNAVEKDRANCAGCNSQPLNQTVPTGTFPPNGFGLLDMAGNAAEWVEDCWEDSYKSAPKDGSAFVKPDCRERVLRGGSFNNDQRFVRTAARFKYDFDVRYYTNGFRVVREK
jgi:formylglycine-generating enzyme required for sulfatase activity